MRCEACRGSGWRSPVQPCYECIGGVASCCDGMLAGCDAVGASDREKKTLHAAPPATTQTPAAAPQTQIPAPLQAGGAGALC
jgi:hypothetical protein